MIMKYINLILSRDATYTTVWNALDYAACVFPVTKVDPAIDGKKPPHQFLSDKDQRNYDMCTSLTHKLPCS